MPLPPSPGGGDDLTGEYRFRKGWWGALVLEVKCRCHGDTLVQRNAFYWRDARESDLWRIRAIRKHLKMPPDL